MTVLCQDQFISLLAENANRQLVEISSRCTPTQIECNDVGFLRTLDAQKAKYFLVNATFGSWERPNFALANH